MDFKILKAVTASFALLPAIGYAQITTEDNAISPAVPSTESAPAAEQDNTLPTIQTSADSQTDDAPVTVSKTESKNRVIEEVVVTSQKREERLQDVPISIQAFSGDAIAARGIDSTGQLAQAVPGFQATNVAGFTLIYIRGIGTDNFIPSADPSIATYVDGVYALQGQAVTQSLANVERVEVLKGPQGTLFGRNATGGAISVVTEEPGSIFKASAEGGIRRFNGRSAKASIGGPLTDWLSASLAGLYSRKDSVYDDVHFVPQADGTRALRFKVNIHPVDELSLSATVFHEREQGVFSQIGKNTDPSLIARTFAAPAPDDYHAVMDYAPSGISTQDHVYSTLTWKLPRFDTKLLASYQRVLTTAANIDFDGTTQPVAVFDTTHEFTNLVTGEWQLISNADTWGSDKFKWVAGLYYLTAEIGMNPVHLRVAPGAFQSLQENLGLPLPQILPDLVSLLPLQNTPLDAGGLTVAINGVMSTDSYSGYAQGTYYFTDWLDLTLGGRYQREQRKLKESNVQLGNFNGDGATTLLTFGQQERSASNFSPKATLSLHPRENTLLYATYSVGYKSGTFNIINLYKPSNYIVPEEVTMYEFGAKADFLNGLMRLNSAVFYNKIKNLQSGFVSVLSGGATRFQTAGSARTKGIEFDGTWVPLPKLDSGLAITANGAYVDAIYTSFKDGSGFQKGTGIYSANLDFSGNQIVRAPKVSAAVGLVQSIEASQGTYEIAVDEYYNSGFYYDAYNTVKENPYAILNAHASYMHDPWNMRLTVFGQNLLDRRYHVQQLQTDFGTIKTLAAPREYGIRLSWDF